MRKIVLVCALTVTAVAVMGTLGAKKASAEEGRWNAYVAPNGWCDYCYAPVGAFCNCQINPPIYIT